MRGRGGRRWGDERKRCSVGGEERVRGSKENDRERLVREIGKKTGRGEFGARSPSMMP